MNLFTLLANAFTPILEAIFTFLNQFIAMPFMMEGHVGELSEEIFATLHMLLIPGIFSFLLGLCFGVILMLTKPNGIKENATIYFILDKFVNFFRSIPFVILIGLLMGLSRLVMGTAIGIEGMYVPLIFGTFPFMARQMESAMSEVDDGLIEASIAMGCSTWDIIVGVYIKESIPSIARGVTITLISMIGIIAMAGAVGAGGLGNFALRYGYQRNIFEATIVSVIIILILVSIVQAIGNYIAKKTTH